jgi:hypothetical protein
MLQVTARVSFTSCVAGLIKNMAGHINDIHTSNGDVLLPDTAAAAMYA